MADIRIKDLPTTASDFSSDDFIAIDGTANGTRKINAKTANLTFSDVTLGASGPSVKSSLAARAARQGLVFNGTNVQPFSTLSSAIGTSAITWSQWLTIPVVSGNFVSLGGISTNTAYLANGSAFTLTLQINGALRVTIPNATNNGGVYADVSGISAFSSKTILLTVTRSGSTLAVYFNGIAQTVTPVLYGTSPGDFSNTISGTTIALGGQAGSSGAIFNGYSSGPNLYNRALSATEVVSLYESGVPSGADYNTANNTALTTGTFSNSGFDTFSGASTTGFTAAETGASGEATSQISNLAVAPAQKFRISFSLTLNSGTAPYVGLAQFGVQFLTGTSAVTAGQVRSVNGTNSIEVTIRSVNSAFATGAGVSFVSTEASNFVVSGLTVTRLGLLLAPDAAQAGGGLAWYDTSGNAANITLPASGVTWNVPTSGVLGGNFRTAGNLNASNGFYVSGSAVSPNNTASVDVSFQGTYGKISAINRGVGNFPLSLQPEGGNLLIGTTTDGGQKLQVAGTGYFSGDLSSAGTISSIGANDGYFIATRSTTSRYALYTYRTGVADDWVIGIRGSGEGFSDDLTYRNGSGVVVSRLSKAGAATFAGAVTAPAAGSLFFGADATYGNSLKLTDSSTTRPSLLAGVSESAGTYTARSATPILLKLASDAGVAVMYVDSGKTPGNTYTPTPVATFGATSTTFAGAVTVNGTGTSTISSATTGAGGLMLRNTAAGTGNYGILGIGNDADANAFNIITFSSTYSGTGANTANFSRIENNQASAGLNLVAGGASGTVNFYAGGEGAGSKVATFSSGVSAFSGSANTTILSVSDGTRTLGIVPFTPVSGGIAFKYNNSAILGIGPNGVTIGSGLVANTDTASLNGLLVEGVIKTNNTTPSTGAGSGALQVAGGIYSGAASYFGGNITFGAGKLLFSGNNEIIAGQDSGGYYFANGNGATTNIPINIGDAASLQVFRTSASAAAGSRRFVIGPAGTFGLGGTISNTATMAGSAISYDNTTLSVNVEATFAGTVIAPAATTAISSVRLPHGAAPTSPVNGDMWTTTAGLYVRINGVTVGPLS